MKKYLRVKFIIERNPPEWSAETKKRQKALSLPKICWGKPIRGESKRKCLDVSTSSSLYKFYCLFGSVKTPAILAKLNLLRGNSSMDLLRSILCQKNNERLVVPKYLTMQNAMFRSIPYPKINISRHSPSVKTWKYGSSIKKKFLIKLVNRLKWD